MPDAAGPGQRLVHQKIGEVDQLAQCAAAVETRTLRRIHGGDARAVIAAIFKPAQTVHKDRCRLVFSDDAYDAAHKISAFFSELCRPNLCPNLGMSGIGSPRDIAPFPRQMHMPVSADLRICVTI